MKYLLLPIHLLKFWYGESLVVFIRTWKNLILYLEEDLALGLMAKLLFVPLFHDASIVGRALSFIFRFSRILLAAFAFLLATLLLVSLAIYWWTLPWLVLSIPSWTIVNGVILFSGVGLFIIHLVIHPHKKVWQIHLSKDLWSSSWVKRNGLSFGKLLQSSEVQSLLAYLEIDPEQLLQANLIDPKINLVKPEVEQFALELAKKSGSSYIGPAHFFIAVLKTIPQIGNFLMKLNLKMDDLEQALFYLEKKKKKWRVVWIWDEEFSVHHLKGVNRGWLGVPTPSLDKVSEDLTRRAARYGFDDFIGRNSVATEVINIISREKGQNVVIVGAPGAGKTALIQYLSKIILAGDAPSALATKRLVVLDTTKLLSGITTQGELAERVRDIFEEIKFAQNIILVIEEIHNLGVGEVSAQFNLYSLMLPYIESSTFQFMATTELENYSHILEKNGAFARLFTKVNLPAATEAETVQILENRAIELERKKRIKLTFLAIKETASLCERLIKTRVLPDSAIDILEEVVAEDKDGWVRLADIRQVISERVNVPVLELGNTDKTKLLNLEETIHQRLIDQEEAVKAVADVLRRSVAGLREINRPIGSFLFVGPTGVGKTELAKILAEVYFSKDAFIRFDMSEYQNPESVERLIGGSGQDGQLTEAVRNKPYALLLLDELEKAHEKILTLFLQVLDDGRLTDATGRTVDFTNTIIIATSNVGSVRLAKGLSEGKVLADLTAGVNEELLQVFRPELVNRFDKVVLFKLLAPLELQQIVKMKLVDLQKLIKDQGYLVDFDEPLIAQLAQKGFDPVLGARPLRRLIQDTLEARLSRMILENQLQKGTPFKAGVELLG